MKPSRYNITIPDYPEQGSMLIFNTLSGSLFELEPAYRRSLETLQSGNDLNDADMQRLVEMAEEGYVVEDEETENAMVIHNIRAAAYGSSPVVKATVVTTMACNLACKYCFESSMEKTLTMDRETARMVFNQITQRVQNPFVQTIDIDYYGGEPLLNIDIIKFLSEKFQAWCQENKKLYGFTMTTNGTLLTPDVIEALKPLGFESARITIDGIKEIHDMRRPFRSGKGSSYDIIMKNLKDTAGMIPITLVNVCSEENMKQLPALLDELEKRQILCKLASFQPGIEQPYFDKQGKVCGTMDCALTKASAENFLLAIHELFRRDLPPRGELLQGTNCSVTAAQGPLIFNADGNIYKCPALMGKPEYAVGHVSQDNLNKHHYECVTKEIWKQCLNDTDCPYVPACGAGAGCRFTALVNSGDIWGDGCCREFHDHYIPEVMKLEHMKKYGET
jgi:uncharacterized protein